MCVSSALVSGSPLPPSLPSIPPLPPPYPLPPPPSPSLSLLYLSQITMTHTCAATLNRSQVYGRGIYCPYMMRIVPSVHECRDRPFYELLRCCNVMCMSPPPTPRNLLAILVGSERHTSTYPHIPRSAQDCVSQQAFVSSTVGSLGGSAFVRYKMNDEFACIRARTRTITCMPV